MSHVEARLRELGIELPTPQSPIANYVPTYRTGDLVWVSGQLCIGADGTLVGKGQVGTSVDQATAKLAARASAINVLAQLKAAVGSLDNVRGVVRLGGFISAGPDFEDHAAVMNGASDLMVEVFGDIGRHARSTVGVASLPRQAVVEIEATFLVATDA